VDALVAHVLDKGIHKFGCENLVHSALVTVFPERVLVLAMGRNFEIVVVSFVGVST